MAKLAQLLGLKPRPGGRISEAAARAAATTHLRAGGAGVAVRQPGTLTWDAAGRAVWRFYWNHPVPGAPHLTVDVDAADGTIVRHAIPPR